MNIFFNKKFGPYFEGQENGGNNIFKKISIILIVCITSPLYCATPWLHTDGNKIKDPCNNIVVLRGVDLIDLGSLQDWQGGAINMIDRLTNKTNTEGNSPGWYPRVIRIDITPPDSVSGWPHPFNPNNTDLYNLLRTVVNYCKTKDLYAIIDWHYIANTYDHVESTSQFWAYMAPRFANDSHVMFELFNEPINDLNGDWIFNIHDTADWLSVRADMQTWINIVRSYAPNNLILVAGPFYSQVITPSASYPLTGDNIVMVSHIYPGHWLDSGHLSAYQNQINTALTRYPVFMSEWGFSMDSDSGLQGTITNYGQPISDFREARQISNSAWVASYNWGPPMFYTDWTLRVGKEQMGGFVKDTLYLKRNDNQPSEGNTIPPAAPTELTATPAIGTITLDWNNNTEGDLYGYDIYRSTTPGGQTARLNLVRSNVSSYTDTNVAGTRTYYYVVTAVDTNFNSSADSIEVSATVPADSIAPSAPAGLTAVGGDLIVSLDWNNNTEPDINGFNVYRSFTSGGPYIKQNTSLIISSDFNDANVTNGTIYYYVVTAEDTSLNESANSGQVAARPQLVPGVEIIGSWSTGTTHAKESGYNRALVFVAHAKSSSGTSSLTAVTYGGRSMTKIIDKIVGSSSSRAYVAAFILNDANIEAASNVTFTPTWTSAPGSITYSSVLLQNVNQTSLVGSSASNGLTGVSTISTSALSTNSGDMVIEAAASSVVGIYSVTTGWTKDADLSVTGYDGMGGHKPASGVSETPSITQSSGNHVLIGFVLKIAPNIAPAAPLGLTASGAIGSIVLDWNNNDEPDFNGYNVYRSLTSGSDYVKLNTLLLSSSDYLDTNVTDDTTYYYVATAVDSAGLESIYSVEVSGISQHPAIGTGSILREWWLDLPGDTLDALYNSENYPFNPTGRHLITKLDGPVNWMDNYAALIRGYLNPVTSGNYVFWISGDNACELYLSTDSSLFHVALMAYVPDFTDLNQWDKYSSQQSSPVYLTAGQKYYIFVSHKEGSETDNISVAWQGPGLDRQIIDGIYLSPCSLKFTDFAEFANDWGQSNCDIANDWCSGSDFNRDGTVSNDDLLAFAESWLIGDF